MKFNMISKQEMLLHKRYALATLKCGKISNTFPDNCVLEFRFNST